MIKRNMYDARELMDVLGKDYILQKLPYTKEYSEDYDDYGVFQKESYFITTLTNIKKIYSSFWTFGSNTKVFNEDGSEIHLSTSTYEGRNDILDCTKNKILSKPVTVKGKFIEVDSDLDEWLIFNGVDKKKLTQMRIELRQEETYKFPFDDVIFDEETCEIVGTTYKKKLTLKEKELAKALSEISDKKTAYKIQYILEKVNDIRIKVKN